MRRTLRANLWWVLWLLLVVAGTCYVEGKSGRVGPELLRRGRLLSLLERAVVATRTALADTPDPDEAQLKRALLDHGVRVGRIERNGKGELARLEIANAESVGWIEIKGSEGMRYVHAWFDTPTHPVELRARVVEAVKP